MHDSVADWPQAFKLVRDVPNVRCSGAREQLSVGVDQLVMVRKVRIGKEGLHCCGGQDVLLLGGSLKAPRMEFGPKELKGILGRCVLRQEGTQIRLDR